MKTVKLIALLFAIPLIAFCQRQRTIVSGEFPHLNDGDTVELLIYRYGHFPATIKELRDSYSAPVISHRFTINLNLQENRPYECRIIIPRLRFTPNIIIVEKGDQLYLSGTDISLNGLSGKGALKTNVLRQMDVIYNSLAHEAAINSHRLSVSAAFQSIVKNSETAVILCREYLKIHGKYLNTIDRNLLSVYAQNSIWEIYNTIYYTNYSQRQLDTVKKQLKKVWLPFRNRYIIAVNPQCIISDFFYSQNMTYDYSLRQMIEKKDYDGLNDNSDLWGKYMYFKYHYTGLIREKMLTALLLSAPRSNDIAICYRDAKKIVTQKDFKTALDLYCQSLPGTPVYNFILLDSNKTVHHLADFKGKVLVLDFWFTGCGNCRELTPKLKLVEEQFKNDPRVMFISISSDKNIELWKSSIRGGLYTTSSGEFNLYTGGHGMSDPLYKKTNTYSAPTLKLIDANGNWCENPIDCRFDDGKDLIAKIEKALVN